MIKWTRNQVGDLISDTKQRIEISGSLSSARPPHAYWVHMFNRNNTEIILHGSKTTEDECKELAEEWVKL